jgi:enterochelin esterase-like enzyme
VPVSELTLRSGVLANERRIWLQTPESGRPTRGLCILLDGEYYVQHMDAPAVIRELHGSGTVLPFAVAYVSHVDGPTRWDESCCNPK